MKHFFLAQGIKDAGNKLEGIRATLGNPEGNVETIAGQVVRAGLTLVGTIFFILMFYAGYLWMTARGEEQKVEKARNIILAAIIGLVIVVSAYAITIFVTSTF